jgi:hypothetical protein
LTKSAYLDTPLVRVIPTTAPCASSARARPLDPRSSCLTDTQTSAVCSIRVRAPRADTKSGAVRAQSGRLGGTIGRRLPVAEPERRPAVPRATNTQDIAAFVSAGEARRDRGAASGRNFDGAHDVVAAPGRPTVEGRLAGTRRRRRVLAAVEVPRGGDQRRRASAVRSWRRGGTRTAGTLPALSTRAGDAGASSGRPISRAGTDEPGHRAAAIALDVGRTLESTRAPRFTRTAARSAKRQAAHPGPTALARHRPATVMAAARSATGSSAEERCKHGQVTARPTRPHK